MDHRERLEFAINRQDVDMIPVAFWKHFPVDDQDPYQLASSTIDFQKSFDFDFVKVSPSSSFCLKDWGVVDYWKGNPEGTREYAEPVIKKPNDWRNLEVLNPAKGKLQDQIDCLKIIKDGVPSDTPIIQTIFSPISQAKNLVGKSKILTHLRSYPEEVFLGLDTITQSTINFIEECMKIKIDGVYFAEQFASLDFLSTQEFMQYGKSFDQKIFPILENFWFNILHIHGKHIMFEQIKDFPLQVFNWHDKETEPDLHTGLNAIKGAVCGGLSLETLVYGDQLAIKSEISRTVKILDRTGLILGTGCVIPMIAPHGNIKCAIDFIRTQ